MILRRAVFMAALVVLAANSALCVDCLMGRYDPNQTSCTTEQLQLPLALNWEYVGNKFDNNPAAPIVADGTVYFASGDHVYAVDLATGVEKWKYPREQALGGSVKATPAINNGNLYFGATDGNLYCLNADTGAFQWAYQTRGAIRCPPVILDRTVYAGSDDNSLYAISEGTGDLLWKRQLRDDVAIGVAIGSGMAVVSCMDGNMYGINANSGKVRWPPFRLSVAPTDSSPVISDTITVMAAGNAMFGLSTRSGQQRWQINLNGEVAATPAVFGHDVYVPLRDKKLYAYTVNGRQPSLKWTAPADLGFVPMSTPVVAGDVVWVTGQRGVVAGYSLVDGSLKWRYTCSPSPVTAPSDKFCDAACSPTVAAGALLVLTDDGVLRCFVSDAPDTEPPAIFSTTPANGSVMSGAPPIKMSAILYDIGSGVDFGNVSIYVDDQPMSEQVVNPGALTVTYQTEMGGSSGKQAVTLKDGIHKIKVTAKDYAGNLLTKEWYIITDASLPPPRRVAPPPEAGKKTKAPATNTGRSSRWNRGQDQNPNQGNTNTGGGMDMPPPPPMPPSGPGGAAPGPPGP